MAKNRKISFSVENIRLFEDNVDKSNFAVLFVDAFSSGESLNNTYVSDETLKKTAHTILLKPFIFSIDEILDDLYTHSDKSVIGGFVPQNSPLEFKELSDGRLMLSCTVLVWKKYSGKLLDYFIRDGKKKSVSVEIEVYEEKKLPNGVIELLDFCYYAITALGDFVRAAIPDAQAVLQFSKEYREDFQKEFGYENINFKIPDSVKKNAQKGLDLYRIYKRGGTSQSLAVARYLVSKDNVDPEKVRRISRRKFKNINSFNEDDEEFISNCLWGGMEGWKWAKELSNTLDEIDNKSLSYFEENGGKAMPYKNLKDINPALKGIDPPISLSQANEIAKQADAIGSDKEKNGWAIAISNFKKTHKVEDGKWVKKEKMSKDSLEEASKENFEMEEKEVNMAENDEKEKEEKEEQKEESPEKEEKETPKEEKKEEPEKEEKKEYSLNPNLDVSAILAFLKEETEDYEEISHELEKAPEEMNYGLVMGAMYNKMCKMKDEMAKMSEDSIVYMRENEELKKYKALKEMEEFSLKVDSVLKEIENRTEITIEELESLKEKSKEFSLETFDTWKNFARSKALDFAIKNDKNESVVIPKYGWDTTVENKSKNNLSPWKRN